MNKFQAATLFVFIAYILLAFVKVQDTEISIKELQILLISETHAEKGIAFTKGLNVYPEQPNKSIYNQKGVKVGGVAFDLKGEYTVYVSCPPLIPLLTSLITPLFKNSLKGSSIFFIFSGIFLLWAFYLFAKNFLDEKERPLFMLLSISPFVLTSYFYNDMNINPFMLSFSLFTYMALVQYVTTNIRKWLYLFAFCFGICIWSSYFTLSLIPSFFIVVFGLPSRKKGLTKKLFIELSLVLTFTILTVLLYHIATLPGFIEKLSERVAERISGTKDLGGEIEQTGMIPIKLWLSRLITRSLSNYSPILFVLGSFGLVTLIIQFLKNKYFTDLRLHVCCFFSWGVPAAFILKNGSYVHPYFLMYFVFFFSLSTLLFLNVLVKRIGEYNVKFALAIKYIILILFLGFSIPRSYLKVSKISLVEVFFKGNVPEIYESK